jgi:hypothetical protein
VPPRKQPRLIPGEREAEHGVLEPAEIARAEQELGLRAAEGAA